MSQLSEGKESADLRNGKLYWEVMIMALSLDSKIKDILRSPEGKAVMEKYAPGSTSNPSMKLVGAMTYRKLLSYPESADVAKFADQIDEDLKKCSR